MDRSAQSASAPSGPPQAGRPALRRRGLLLLQIAVAALLLVTLVVFVDWRSLLARLVAIEPWSLVAAGLALGAVLFVGAFDLWVLLRGLAPLSYAKVLRIYVIAWSSFLVLPGSAGDAVQILFYKEADVGYREGTGIYLTDKLITLAFNVALAMAGGWLFLRGRIRPGLVGLMALAVGLVAVVAWRLVRAPRHRLVEWGVSVVTFAAGYARRRPRRIVANAAGTVLKLAVGALPYWIVLRGLGVAISPQVVLLATYTAALVAYVPVAFNGLGTVELAAVALYGSRGVPADAVLGLYLVIRAIVVVLAVLGFALSAAGRRRR